jgi:hypothetical protein
MKILSKSHKMQNKPRHIGLDIASAGDGKSGRRTPGLASQGRKNAISK